MILPCVDCRARLAAIIDEHLGPQEVLESDELLTRLERLLNERGRQHEAAIIERDDARIQLASALARNVRLRALLEDVVGGFSLVSQLSRHDRLLQAARALLDEEAKS